RPPTPPAPAASVATASSAAVPQAAATTGATDEEAGVPAQTNAAAAIPATQGKATAPAQTQLIKVRTDVLALTIDARGGTVVKSHLLKYPESLGSKQSVQLLSNSAERFYEAQSGLIGVDGNAAPNHKTLFRADKTRYTLAPGQKQL